jgi:hypothetical protein
MTTACLTTAKAFGTVTVESLAINESLNRIFATFIVVTGVKTRAGGLETKGTS